MLLNLTQDICVSKHVSADTNRWICYSPCLSANNKKRITWQKITGLLTTERMQDWLNTHYPDDCHAEVFSSIAK